MIVTCAIQSGSTPKKPKFKHSDEARAIAVRRRNCRDRDERKRLSLLLMREASKHVRSWQSSQLKTIMSKPFKRHELERIWQVPKRNKQVELDIESHATALADLYKDEDHAQRALVEVDIADIQLFEWFELEDELHAMSNNKSSDSVGVTAEMLKLAPIPAKDVLLSLLNALLVHGCLPVD